MGTQGETLYITLLDASIMVIVSPNCVVDLQEFTDDINCVLLYYSKAGQA